MDFLSVVLRIKRPSYDQLINKRKNQSLLWSIPAGKALKKPGTSCQIFNCRETGFHSPKPGGRIQTQSAK